MEENNKDFLASVEQLYHEYYFPNMSKETFLEYVKKEVQEYMRSNTVSSEEDKIELLYNIMEKIPKEMMEPENTKVQVENKEKRSLLSRQEERALLERAVHGDLEARQILIEKNIGLVKSRACKYLGLGLPLEDLEQQGAIALMEAIRKYDLTKEYRLSTYAVTVIDGKLLDYLSEVSGMVRFPKNIPTYLKKIKDLEVILERVPTIEEITEELKVSKKMAQRLIQWRNSTMSLNMMVGEGKEELGSFIPTKESTEDQFLIRDMQEETQRLLEILNHNEQQVLIMLYGLYGVRKRTLEEIAQIMDVKHQRVSVIEATAIRKLRLSDQIFDMAVYMDDPKSVKQNILFYREQYQDPKNKIKKDFVRPKEYVKK